MTRGRLHRTATIFIESDRKDDLPAYARQVIREFAARAFRRPINAQEESSLPAVFEKSLKAGVSFRDSVKDALQVVLTSPQFLFLIEESTTPAPEPLDDYELASKLSYFLWNGPPDRAVVETGRGRFAARNDLDSEITRMIDDPRFERFVGEFTAAMVGARQIPGARTRSPSLPETHSRHARRNCGKSPCSSSSI